MCSKHYMHPRYFFPHHFVITYVGRLTLGFSAFSFSFPSKFLVLQGSPPPVLHTFCSLWWPIQYYPGLYPAYIPADLTCRVVFFFMLDIYWCNTKLATKGSKTHVAQKKRPRKKLEEENENAGKPLISHVPISM